MIEVIKDGKQWNQQLSLIEHLDTYHTHEYHHITKNAGESPILIKYTDGRTSLFLPLLLRPIENSNYKDAISVYGYTGILTLSLDEHFNKKKFHNELNAFFNENKIISVFSRLHPFLNHQESLLEGLGTIVIRGKVVYIDLNTTLEDQIKLYHKRMKTYLNKSRTTCMVIESKLENDLDTFIDLYHQNMKRVDAEKNYYFDKSYFQQLMLSKEFTTKLTLCIHNETQTVVGGALFMKKGKFVQYHLSGFNEEYSALNPIKLLIDEERITSTNQGFEYLNLGGGRGSAEDSLFKFKLSFSNQVKEFKIWKYVVDENAYRMLVENHLECPLEVALKNTEFFPAYRSTEIFNS
ncbi:MAG: peptidoglycan bridge formation glycyltransferase FemA/FemB family protein [Gelidibacter sp.]